MSAKSHLKASDVRSIAQLATEATTSVTRLTEGVHQAVWRTLGSPSGEAKERARGITGMVYSCIVGVTQLVGKSVDLALTALQPLFTKIDCAAPGSPEREAVLAALNGVMGDRLAARGNALATTMSLRHGGNAIDLNALAADLHVTGKVLVLVHGLCMNDLQWRAESEQGSCDHGALLARELGYTPLYLRYNTGLHASQNGEQLAALLERLVAAWPVPIEDLSIVAHSMGGLVTRSACRQAAEEALWLRLLKHIVFLGTPHHGAPLERAGNWVDVLLGSTPYSAPFARLGQLRSAGITDLRFGFVQQTDWEKKDRFRRTPDRRTPVPLPERVASFTIAACLAGQRSTLADRLVGDGLVPLRSALGEHEDAEHDLGFAKSARWIAYRTNHIELLRSATVGRKMVEWLRNR